MFQSLKQTSRTTRLVDDDFTYETVFNDGSISDRVNIVITQYQQRGLAVAPNVARFYRWFWRHDGSYWREPNTLAKDNLRFVETNYPELEYRVKYYPCVLRQLEQQTWSGKR